MSTAETVRPAPSPGRSVAPEIGLFLILLLGTPIAIDLLFADRTVPRDEGVATALTLIFFIHVGFSLYHGGLNGWRCISWVLLIGSWVFVALSGFLTYLLPWGQIAFWLSSIPLVGRALAFLPNGSLRGGILLLIPAFFLVLDLWLAHHARWAGRAPWRLAVFLLAVGICALALGYMTAGLSPDQGDSFIFDETGHIIPEWHLLPYYAILRAVPTKLGGVIALFIAMIAPIAWPWWRVERLRVGAMRWIWLLASLAFAASWIGLAFLGARPVESATPIVAQLLTVYCFAYLLVLPALLNRLQSPGAPEAV